MTFKIDVRKDCKVCGGSLPKRFRTYCSAQCRNKFFNKKNAWRGLEWQRAKRAREATEPSDKKVQCLVCGKWYVQVCTHSFQVHNMNGREYREYFNLEVKRGVVPGWYREMKGEQALNNGTYKNLKNGRKFRYKKGSKIAGRYKRSPVTLARLSNLKKIYGKHHKDSRKSNRRSVLK